MLTIQSGYRPQIGYGIPYLFANATGNARQDSYEKSWRFYNSPLVVTEISAIASSTNATPIVVTFGAGNLTPKVGDAVVIGGHLVNTNANNTPSNPMWLVSAAGGGTFTLQTPAGVNSVGNGVGGATGTVIRNSGIFRASVIPAGVGPTGPRLRPTLGLLNGT